MAPRTTRRALLRAAGIATAAGLAGCGSTGEPSPTVAREGTTTYDVEVQNKLTADLFEATEALSGPAPATVTVKVGTLSPGDEPFFEETTEVATDSTKRFAEAFTVESDGPTYAMSAEFEAFTDDGLSGSRNRKTDLTFAPGERPRANPVRVVLQSLDPDDVEGADGMYPVIGIREKPVEA
jgi:hypothetical protein